MNHDLLHHMGRAARQASHKLAQASTGQKNLCLQTLCHELALQSQEVLSANESDLKEAALANFSSELMDRLSLQGRLEAIINDIQNVIELPDPIGEIIESRVLRNGLHLSKQRTPIGVLGVIYEARPNVTIDIAILAIKTGNAAILRGGKESLKTNRALIKCIQKALFIADLPQESIQIIENPQREIVNDLLKMHQHIDLIIPRGGASLHQFCREHSSIPVITGGIGICHLFVDDSAHMDKAIQVIYNAKAQRPTVCNALDTVLIHAHLAPQFLPLLADALLSNGVELHLDEQAWNMIRPLQSDSLVKQAEPEDWDKEWLSLILGVRIVSDLKEALEHIQKHSSGHSDGILTEDIVHAQQFTAAVDSAVVYVNASTRFTDGGQFGFGAEVAISTQKLHARGPMGLKELTSYKWIVQGDYHIRL